MTTSEIRTAIADGPTLEGRSKQLYRVGTDRCLIRLKPTLDSATHARHETVEGTAELRLDFFEMAAQRLQSSGVPVAFDERVARDMYLAELCTVPPFEVIVKRFACGSTLRNYPGLFVPEEPFANPVVKFDYRVDPEDRAIAEDYVREAGEEPNSLKRLAIDAAETLVSWLHPLILVDICFIFGRNHDDQYVCVSEVSPDCMRLRTVKGDSLDKDLFRQGATGASIVRAWAQLVGTIRGRTEFVSAGKASGL